VIARREEVLADLRRRLALLQQSASLARQSRTGAALAALPLSTRVGNVAPPGDVDQRVCQALGAGGADLTRVRVLDTETTGLAGGAGTLAFLIGVAFWEGGVLRVEQLLLDRPGDERPLLERLDGLLKGAGVLVTFNGRTFDVPLLRTRYLMNRMSSRALEVPHLDLLPPARRLFGARSADCRLQTLEWQVLARRRDRADDLPGPEIPLRYQSWLRTGDAGALRAVVEHNRRDVVSTAALLGVVLPRLADPLGFAEDGWELLAAAELWHRAGDPDRADAALERGIVLSQSLSARRRLLRMRARLARRSGRNELARVLWELYRTEFPDENLGHLEAAKLYEHRLKDPASALLRAESAPMRTEEVIRRVARLRKRCDQAALRLATAVGASGVCAG
jgi:uncharacterized protein YprB with RNaseH-like and TPR domain